MKKLLMTAGAVMLAAVAQADLKDEITISFSSDLQILSEENHIQEVKWESDSMIQTQYSLAKFMERLRDCGGEMRIQVEPFQGYTFDGVSMPDGWNGGICSIQIDTDMLNEILTRGEGESVKKELQMQLSGDMGKAFRNRGGFTYELDNRAMPVAKRSPVQVNWTVGNHVNASVTQGNVAISNGAQVSLPATIDVSAVADDGYIFKNPGAGWSLSADGKTITQSFKMEESFGNSRLEFSIPSPVRPGPEVTIGNVASVKPWVSANGEVAVDYSVANINADGWYKVAFDITAGGKTAGVTNDAAQLVEGAQAQKVIATTALFGKETVAKDAKVKVSLIAVKPAK